MINFPAPEEARSYKDYVSLFKQANPGVDFKEACASWMQALRSDQSFKQYYDWCWQQPEAESIHLAFK